MKIHSYIRDRGCHLGSDGTIIMCRGGRDDSLVRLLNESEVGCVGTTISPVRICNNQRLSLL